VGLNGGEAARDREQRGAAGSPRVEPATATFASRVVPGMASMARVRLAGWRTRTRAVMEAITILGFWLCCCAPAAPAAAAARSLVCCVPVCAVAGLASFALLPITVRTY